MFVNRIAYAKSVYYTNPNQVEFTKNEYDIIRLLYDENYIETITIDEFNKIDLSGYLEYGVKNGTYTQYDSMNRGIKTLSYTVSCSDICVIKSTLVWTSIPSIKKYDVFGARLVNTSLVGIDYTRIIYDGNSFDSGNYKYLSNGFGASFKIPSSISNTLETEQKFFVDYVSGASVVISYQHARHSDSTLAKSKNYTISPTGFGGVFNFTYSYIYDGMSGITINL
jgi:hypothetical protein